MLPGLVIFDCDGVLVDSEPISNRCLASALTRAGLTTTPAEAEQAHKGQLLTEIVQQAEDRLGRPLPHGWLEEFERERDKELRAGILAIPHAAWALKRLRAANVRMCVASQGKVEKSELTLRLTGLREFFAPQAIFSAQSVVRGKPHPDLFLHAAAAMGARPPECVVVEDTAGGIQAAIAAGMKAVGYAAGAERRALTAAGAELIYSLRELPPLIGVTD